MANPQIENGHTKIANEIMGALMRTSFAASDRQVLDCIFAKTYGWNKKTDRLSYKQIQAATGLSRRMVIYCIENLKAKNIITIDKETTGDQLNIIGIQKDFDKWMPKAVSATYQNMLDQKKRRYKKSPTSTDMVAPMQRNDLDTNIQATPVQKNDPTSAEKGTLPVQRNGFTSADSLHPQKHTKAITKAITKAKEILPDWIDKKVWDDFWDFRAKIKFPKTDGSIKATLRDLEKLRAAGDDPNEVLEQSMSRGWRGVFPLKHDDAKEKTFGQKKGGEHGTNRRHSETDGGRQATNEELRASAKGFITDDE